jgi:hypothetical protein
MNIGWMLYGLHQFTLILFVSVFVVRPNLRPFLIIVFIPIAFFHVSGHPCPFSRLERYYHGQNVTIIDPFLNMFGLEITLENRQTFQAYLSSLLLLAMGLTVLIYPSK